MIHARARVVHEQTACVHGNLPGRIELHKRTIHGTRRRAFEVHAFTVISASMTRTLEFIFRRLPFRSAAKVRAPSENDEETVRLSHNPNAIGHQEALIDSKREVGRK